MEFSLDKVISEEYRAMIQENTKDMPWGGAVISSVPKIYEYALEYDSIQKASYKISKYGPSNLEKIKELSTKRLKNQKEFNLIKEKKQYEVELFKAKSKKVAADAQYYENAKLVSAGLTPQEKAEWEFKTAVGVAEQLKELKLPETYIEGGKTGQTGNLLESLIGADLAKSMIQKKK